jgi:protein TonB
MKTTEKPKNNLEKLRGIFFQIGLIVATSITFLAFEWTTPVYIAELPKPFITIEDDFEIPIIIYNTTPIKPEIKPIAPKVDPSRINIIKTTPVDPTPDPEPFVDPDPVFDPNKWTKPEVIEAEEAPLPAAGKMPFYKNCENANENERKSCTEEEMFKHFRKTLKIPSYIKDLGKAEYTAHVYFEVNKKGQVKNVRVLNSGRIPLDLEKEAINAVISLPELIPAINHGKQVSVYYSIPIKFTVKG